MKDIALDENGDIYLEANDLSYVTGDAAAAQKVRQVLGTKLGEWIYNEREGLDFDAFFDKSTTEQRMQEAIRAALDYLDEGYALESFSYDTAARRLTVSVRISQQTVLETYAEV